jgi:hypothetical protein
LLTSGSGNASTSKGDLESGVELLRLFRGQLRALSDERILEILRAFADGPFVNGEVRVVLGVKRKATWVKLEKLVQLGLVEKRGHTYRISRFTRDFVAKLSHTLESLITGAGLSPTDPRLRDVLNLALTGLETLYARGKLDQNVYFGRQKMLKEMNEQLEGHTA